MEVEERVKSLRAFSEYCSNLGAAASRKLFAGKLILLLINCAISCFAWEFIIIIGEPIGVILC